MPIKKLLDGHQKFLEGFKKNHKLFNKLAVKGQKPKVLWIGCSDSRVVPQLVMGADPGDLFVIRNIANIIPPLKAKDYGTSSALEFAVKVLEVEHIVICGHTDCGGIKTLMTAKKSKTLPAVHNWLNYSKTIKEKIIKGSDQSSIYLDSVKQNILLQEENLLTFNFVKSRVNSRKIKIHKWLYNLETGVISAFEDNKRDWIKL